MKEFIKIHPNDNTAVALNFLPAGKTIQCDDFSQPVTLKENIPQGHKFALYPISKNSHIIKYGYPIGYATTDIDTGTWIHTHNIKTTLNDCIDYVYTPSIQPLSVQTPCIFQGFRRPDGKVGIRNEIWIIPTVGCVNNIATAIERQSKKLICGSIDDVVAFNHPYGCSQMSEDQENTRKILADLVRHPNAGGILVLGLGCENSNVDELKKYIGPYDPNRVRFLVAQESNDEIADALDIINDLCAYAGQFIREPISCSELIVGMKCGGSDGLSGITANPVVGKFSDLLISKGGTTILTEVPEMFGAEKLLMNRCANETLFEQTVSLINDFKDYFKIHHQTIYENPSPGNKKGGISTLEDKSLGCVQKSGTAPVKGILSYGETITAHGLHLLSAPGNDLVASTALAASGAHLVLFTTGRGTPFACPVPTVKISTNNGLNAKKNHWIDFNCGTLIETDTLDSLTDQLFDTVIDIASGKKVKSELAGFHDMAIFKQGVTL
ncbi:MAG: altronate dehydratase family protein [Clostridiales bacterium]|nr:altronate dehydratase family protein [Clostridiales bacterium]MDY3745662.1 altronate dehydratase family protein [Lachnospiraceae bacterium]